MRQDQREQFLPVVSAVMATLGVTAFAKGADGFSVLSDGQDGLLEKKFGKTFVDTFMADLLDLEKEAGAVEGLLAHDTGRKEREQKDADLLAELKGRLDRLEEENKRLAAMESPDRPLMVATGTAAPKGFVPDMSMTHNRNYFASTGDAWTGDTTVDTEQLKKEFGKYVSAERMDIFRKLLGTTVSLQHMSTIVTDKFEVRATESAITSVLQTFTPEFTPKGKTKFTPMVIRQYPMKINVEIYPSDIINDVLGYLYDEGMEPKDMPIVRYIVMSLVKPKLDEEREQAFATGRYKEPVKGEDGHFKANDATEVCDGYLTQLVDLRQKGDTDITWLLPDVAALGEGAQLLEQVEKAVDSVSPLYKNKKMTIHADPDLVLKYSRAYRDKYPNTKNQDGRTVAVDYTNFTFAELDGMRGTGAFFITPKENFKHIMSRDPRGMSLRMTSDDYKAKVLGEWREGVGFWMKEAIFAYLPQGLCDSLKAQEQSVDAFGDEGI